MSFFIFQWTEGHFFFTNITPNTTTNKTTTSNRMEKLKMKIKLKLKINLKAQNLTEKWLSLKKIIKYIKS